MQFQDHHQFSKSDHRRRLLTRQMAPISAQPIPAGLTPPEWVVSVNVV
jgi:hypothetical protein